MPRMRSPVLTPAFRFVADCPLSLPLPTARSPIRPWLPAGPKACELPRAAAGRPVGAGNPEGQRLLNESAAALRSSHVEFAHQAHQDLMEVRGLR